ARFSLPPGAQPRPVQQRAVEIAWSMARPGLMLIEAPMGEGKTEAALAVAEIFAARSGAGGCYVALPTMATGNAMFPRLLAWLHRVFASREGRQAVHLAHSKAALNEQYRELIRAGRRAARGVEVDGSGEERRPSADRRVASAGLVAHQWL